MEIDTKKFMQDQSPSAESEIIDDGNPSEGGQSIQIASQRFTNPRVQFLRLAAITTARQGVPGQTPPFCPLGPTLLREPFEEGTGDPGGAVAVRPRSPLRVLALSSYATPSSLRMPHAVSMPSSGFQALILCGPGIGLSTFTSVPSEYPKALISIANRPMVWYVLDWCYRMGVTDITLITPPSSQAALKTALSQNPYLTSLPLPSPDLLAPPDLDHTMPTAALLRLPEVQKVIKTDFILLPCDLISDVAGETFLETYLTILGGLGGVGTTSGNDLMPLAPEIVGLGGERSGRRGGLSIFYNTANREESVKHEECDFMCTVKLDPQHEFAVRKDSTGAHEPLSTLRKLVWAMPMSELKDECEESKSWSIRQSLLSKYGAVKCLTKFRDSHIYLLPYWVKDFARLNENFESVSEDLIGTWAKCDWRKPSYRARFGVQEIFNRKPRTRSSTQRSNEVSIENQIDLLSLSSTQITRVDPTPTIPARRTARLASRVHADLEDSILSPNTGSEDEIDTRPIPPVPPILSYIHPSDPSAKLIRRVDTTPLLLSVSLLLAKIPALDEETAAATTPGAAASSLFAHTSKVASSARVAQRVTISRSDSLIDANTSIAAQCVIKASVIGAACTIGTGARLSNCVIMDGATVGDRCVLTGTVIGKKASIGNECVLQGCEVQDENVVAAKTELKNEKLLIGGLEDVVDGEDSEMYDVDDDDDDEDGEDGNESGNGKDGRDAGDST